MKKSSATDVFQSIKGSGMANTYSGFKANADLVGLNAATLTALENRFAVSAGMNAVFNYTAFRSDTPSMYSATTDNPYYFPYFANIAYGITPRVYVGIAVSSHNLSGVRWQDEDWIGRFMAREWVLSATTLQPAFTFKLTEYLSVGAGITLSSNRMNYTRSLPLRDQNQEGSMKITGKDLNYSFNVSAFLRLTDDFAISLRFQPSADYHFDEASASYIVPTSLSPYFPADNKVIAIIPQPARLEGIAGWMYNEKMQFLAGATWVMNNEDKNIAFEFSENNSFLQDFTITSHLQPQWIIRLGTEYIPFEYLQLRAGTWYQGTSFSNDYFSPASPDMAKIAFTTGASILPVEGLTIDLSFEFITGSLQNATYSPSNFGGSYKTYSFIPGIGIGYSF